MSQNRGGDIQHTILKKILSIGFELESTNLSKFTLLENTDNAVRHDEVVSPASSKNGTVLRTSPSVSNVLINTDTAGQELGRLYKQLEKINTVKVGGNSTTSSKMSSSGSEESDDFQRRQEIFTVDAYTTKSLKSGVNLQKMPNSSMIIANDLAVTPTSKYLKKMCKPYEDDVVADALEFDEDIDEDAREEFVNEATAEFKNQLYTFEPDSGKPSRYPLTFAMANKKDCGMFSKVEWIFTYYQPHHSGNIILDMFANVARNLSHHLKKLTSQTGKLVMNFTSKNKHVVPNPAKRQLFHLPGTNLHYLQTHLHDEKQTIDDICIVPQMTFSCNVVDMLPITKALIVDSLKINDDYTELTVDRMTLIDKLEHCVDDLITGFSKTHMNAKRSPELVVEGYNERKPSDTVEGGFNIREKDPVMAEKIKNYLFLFLFKLYQYYNHYLQDEHVKANAEKIMYLKDTLFINSRHSNYALYVELKRCMGKMMGQGTGAKDIVRLVQRLILQPKILNECMMEETGNVRKNAFSMKNVLDKGHKNYGDPHYSLASYLQFFEDPEEDNRIKDISENFRDWLYHNDLDVFSNTMDIRNDVVLAELRTFPSLLSLYMNSIADSKLFKELRFGACNRAKNKFTSSYGGRFTIGALKQFADLYDKIQSKAHVQNMVQEKGLSRLTRRTKNSGRSTKKTVDLYLYQFKQNRGLSNPPYPQIPILKYYPSFLYRTSHQ